MPYKLASRDNINTELLNPWPAILDNNFKLFNNAIETQIFHDEDQIMNWLEAKRRDIKLNKYSVIHKNKLNNQSAYKNGNPNKLYSVYECNHDNVHHGMELRDTHLYDMRIKKNNEAHSTFKTSNGKRVLSSFIKVNRQLILKEKVEYSSDMRIIRDQYYEGIYPLDINNDKQEEVDYMNYVTKIHNMDIERNMEKKFSIIVADTNYTSKWLEIFINKLMVVERYLCHFASGGKGNISLGINHERDAKIKYVLNILSEHRQGTIEDAIDHNKITNLVVDPLLYDGNTYQIRYKDTMLSWHKNYSYMLRKYQMIPSREFAEHIFNFNIASFYGQQQNINNLDSIIKNLEDYYGVENVIMNTRFVGNKSNNRKVKYHKITKSFI